MASEGQNFMAKRQKIAEDTVCGYIHDVSPIKTSARNAKYFDGKIQIDSDVYQKIVCFDPSKHSHFVEAEHGKSPIKITAIKEVINRENNKNTDVLVNARSRMEVAKNLTFMFHPLETNDEKEPKKIQEIIQNIPERNTVSVLAKVIAVKQESVQEVRKVLLKKKEITIADETSMISLTLWDTLVDDPNISLNAVIFFRNISTRLFSNVKSLTKTKDTTYELTENQTAFQGVDENTYITESKTATVEGEVVNILIKKTNHCLSCNRKMLETETKSQFIKCAGCNMKFKVSAMDTTLTSTFQIKTNENTIKLNAYNATLMHFLISVQKEHLKNDPDELENFLLLLPRVKVEYAKGENVVSKISVLT